MINGVTKQQVIKKHLKQAVMPDFGIDEVFYPILADVYSKQILFNNRRVKLDLTKDVEWLVKENLLIENNGGYYINGIRNTYVSINKPITIKLANSERTNHLLPYFDDLTLADHNINGLVSLEDLEKSAMGSFVKGDFKRHFQKTKIEVEARMMIAKCELESGIFRFKASATRLFTPVTNMKRQQRLFLRYKGKSMKEMDLTNAVPFLCLVILNPEKHKLFRIDKMLPYTKAEAILKLIYSLQGSDELAHYTELVSTGTLYNLFDSREGFKSNYLKMLYNKPVINKRFKQKLMRIFPKIIGIFDLIKIDFVKTRREGRLWSDPGNKLCSILSFVESELILNHVTKRFGHGCFTIHDAILTTNDRYDELLELFYATTEELIGVRPTIK